MKNTTLLFLVGLALGVSGCTTDEGMCEDICATVDDCDGANVDIDDCVAECVDDADNADDRCYESYELAAECASEVELDCDDARDDCDDEIEDFADDCDDDFEDTFEEMPGFGVTPPTGSCPFTNDGECDEPEGTGICAEGTDVNDCAF
jgi:hypothetical protein